MSEMNELKSLELQQNIGNAVIDYCRALLDFNNELDELKKMEEANAGVYPCSPNLQNIYDADKTYSIILKNYFFLIKVLPLLSNPISGSDDIKYLMDKNENVDIKEIEFLIIVLHSKFADLSYLIGRNDEKCERKSA